jgi:hypothetical protein
MHVYLKEEPVDLQMRAVDDEGLVANDVPSFRALLPPETVMVLQEAVRIPVQLGLLAEEPEEAGAEIRAMVGLTLPAEAMPGGVEEDGEDDDEEGEGGGDPWAADPDAWKADEGAEGEEGERSRTVLLAFAPLVRIARKFPDDFTHELADLLESALAGRTKPSLEARVDRMLGF